MGQFVPEVLCRFDDLATSVVVDAVLKFQSHKMNLNHQPLDPADWKSIRSVLREFRDLLKWLDPTKDAERINQVYKETFDNLLHLRAPFRNTLSFTDDKKIRLREHFFRFMKFWDPNSGFTIRECSRYSREGNRGAALFATRAFKKGETIEGLKGCLAPMTDAEENAIVVVGKNDYSILIRFERRNGCKSTLWLGPAAFINHDCKPNCDLIHRTNKSWIEATRDIRPNEELLMHYGKDCWGINCIECECRTCELGGNGAFTNAATCAPKPQSIPNLRNFKKRRSQEEKFPILSILFISHLKKSKRNQLNSPTTASKKENRHLIAQKPQKGDKFFKTLL
ncbi:Oidioi.mRNA.OKI2018_I69.PAR.g11635.t1.cds [Oikopleura dioica]|uniref:[histone H4]-N-methyl-L-lysine20 N-methyltransferase KMT5B n=1 Tax=Oikopleura dioica TaxID=34765 RepID=A0ABN7S1C9_OIKDI|nr:Oidioi.mRNA.OKI2018_I69.PAR.g11635.t1.cds [Oikopleura dioica]